MSDAKDDSDVNQKLDLKPNKNSCLKISNMLGVDASKSDSSSPENNSTENVKRITREKKIAAANKKVELNSEEQGSPKDSILRQGTTSKQTEERKTRFAKRSSDVIQSSEDMHLDEEASLRKKLKNSMCVAKAQKAKTSRESMIPLQDSKIPATSTLLVTNLQRPLLLKEVESLLSEVCPYQSLQLNKIKSKCRVQYATTDKAIQTRNHLYGRRFRAQDTKPLLVEFTSPNEIKQVEKPHTLNQVSKNVMDSLFMKTSTKPSLYYLPRSTLET